MKGNKAAQKKRKPITAVLLLLLSICLCVETGRTPVTAAPETDTFEEEAPSQSGDYWQIRTIDDLLEINSRPESNYILMNDIDMTAETSPGGSWDTGNGWTPLKNFSGTLEGNGHRIIGMHIYGDLNKLGSHAGLFSSLEGNAVIRNLGIVDCDINVEQTNQGPYHGYTADYPQYVYIGGIAGEASYNSSISSCYVDGTIQAASYGGVYKPYIGGVAGCGEIRDCFNAAEITARTLSGYNEIIAGGITGAGDVKTCYNIGKIDVSSSSENQSQSAGAIAGRRSSFPAIAGNYYLAGTAAVGIGDCDNDQGSGCKALTDAQMRRAGSFAEFQFSQPDQKGAWIIDELSSEPYPQLYSCPRVRIEKLELKTLPDKLTYYQGDALDLTGGVLSITYENGVVTSTGLDKNMIVIPLGMDEGTQTVHVRYMNAEDADCTFDITIKAMEAADITLSKNKCTIARNEKMQLDARITPANVTDKSVQWTSDNEVVATVTKNGLVRAVNAGTAKITAVTGNGLSASCVVTVTVPAKSIVLGKTNLTLKKGKQKKLTATLTPLESTDTIEWSSSDPKTASVNKNGVVKARKNGYVTIMAKTSSGKKAYVKITVK